MLFPDLKEFSRRAKDATLVSVAKRVPGDLRTTVSAFLSVAAEEPNAFLLESVEGGENVGRHTFLGARPYMIVRTHGDQITVEKNGRKQEIRGGIFTTLDQLLREHTPAHVPGLLPFTGGALGFFVHDSVRSLETRPTLA